jgi:hypothetical protein
VIPVILAVLGLIVTVARPLSADGQPGWFLLVDQSEPLDRVAAGASEAQRVAQPIREAIAAIQARILSGVGPTDLRAISNDLVHVNNAGEIQVYVIFTEFRPEYAARLEAMGLRIELTLPDYRLIQGWVPANTIDLIAGLDFVAEVKPPGYPVPRGG